MTISQLKAVKKSYYVLKIKDEIKVTVEIFSNTVSQKEEIEQILTVNEFNKKDFRNPGKKLVLLRLSNFHMV